METSMEHSLSISMPAATGGRLSGAGAWGGEGVGMRCTLCTALCELHYGVCGVRRTMYGLWLVVCRLSSAVWCGVVCSLGCAVLCSAVQRSDVVRCAVVCSCVWGSAVVCRGLQCNAVRVSAMLGGGGRLSSSLSAPPPAQITLPCVLLPVPIPPVGGFIWFWSVGEIASRFMLPMIVGYLQFSMHLTKYRCRPQPDEPSLPFRLRCRHPAPLPGILQLSRGPK